MHVLGLPLYVVASKYSQNHFIYEKYETVKSFKRHFLQNNPLVQLNTSVSDCQMCWKCSWKSFCESHFSSSVTFLMSAASQSAVPSMLISAAEQVKLSYKILDHNRLVCWSIVVKENPTAGSPFFWTFSSNRIPKMTNRLNVRYIHSFNTCNS